jgi:hypothetical protein
MKVPRRIVLAQSFANARRLIARTDPAVPLVALPGARDAALESSSQSIVTLQESPMKSSRRDFLVHGLVVGSSLALPGMATADAPRLSEDDPAAKAMGYREGRYKSR